MIAKCLPIYLHSKLSVRTQLSVTCLYHYFFVLFFSNIYYVAIYLKIYYLFIILVCSLHIYGIGSYLMCCEDARPAKSSFTY